jgi:hypothetical protein
VASIAWGVAPSISANGHLVRALTLRAKNADDRVWIMTLRRANRNRVVEIATIPTNANALDLWRIRA